MKTTRIFRDLHSNPGKPLILPNVWDAGGARLVESVGAKAVATTSAGVAWSKGYPDGNKMQPRLLAHLAGEIVKTVKVPVSIDFEAGYSDKPVVVVEYLKPIVAAGISGINIEDGIDEPALLAKKIEANDPNCPPENAKTWSGSPSRREKQAKARSAATFA